MTYVISWLWSPVAGMMSVISLVVSWGALISVVFAMIGLIRRRCRWTVLPTYLLISLVGTFFFRAVFWISDRIAYGDTVSTVLFWGAVLTTGLGALGQGVGLLRQTWAATNGVNEKAA